MITSWFIMLLMTLLIIVLGLNLKKCQETEIRLRTVTTELCEEYMIEQLNKCKDPGFQPLHLKFFTLSTSIYFF